VESVSRRCTNEIRSRRIPGKSTYTANCEVRRFVELKGAFEGGLDLGTNFVLRLPYLLLLLLVAIKMWGAPVLDHRPLGSRGDPCPASRPPLKEAATLVASGKMFGATRSGSSDCPNTLTSGSSSSGISTTGTTSGAGRSTGCTTDSTIMAPSSLGSGTGPVLYT